MTKGVKTKVRWNSSIMREGVIVVLNKNGTERYRKDPKTGDIIKKGKK